MTTFYINDFGSTATGLEDKYDPDDNSGEHPGYRVWDWHQAVASRSTRLGYWDWVVTQLQEEEDELIRDNPFN